jgi:hypothetical protein
LPSVYDWVEDILGYAQGPSVGYVTSEGICGFDVWLPKRIGWNDEFGVA